MFVTTGSRATRRRSGSPPLVLNFGTITTNPGEPTPGMALSIYGTWNNASVGFDAPLFMNVTNTASQNFSYLADFQANGVQVIGINPLPNGNNNLAYLQIGIGAGLLHDFNHEAIVIGGGAGAIGLYKSGGNNAFVMNIAPSTLAAGSAWCASGFAMNANIGGIAFGNGAVETSANIDAVLFRDHAVGVLAIGNGTTNSGSLRVYNTTDQTGSPYSTFAFSAPTNYERGVFDWVTTGNTLSIGTQAGGTGTVRNILLVVGTTKQAAITGNSIQLPALGGTNPLTGGLAFTNNTSDPIGGSVEINMGRSGTTGLLTIGNPSVANGVRVYNSGINTGNNEACSVGDWTITTNQASVGTVAAGTGNNRLLNVFSATTVVNIGSSGVATNWMNWQGQRRVTSDVSVSNSTTFTAITGISSIPISQNSSNRNYKFEAWLAVAGSTVGGISIGITCTSTTISALSADGFMVDSNVVRGQQGIATSTGTLVVNTSAVTSSAPTIRISGLIRGVSSGVFGLSMAQSTSNATAVIVSSGSWLEVFDVP